MKYYRFPENKSVKAGFFLFLLALQLLSRSTMYSSTFIGAIPAQLIAVGLVCLAGVIFLIHNRKNWKPILTDRRMIAAAVFSAVILIPMLLKQDWQLMYFTVLFCMLFPVLLSYFTTLEEVGRCYVLLHLLLSLCSLVGIFVGKPLVHAGVIPGNPFDSPGGWHMYNFGLAFVCDRNNLNDDALRAFGVFREPGLYQAFLFVAIYLNNDVVRWNKPWKMWAVNAVLFVSMLTTFATGGVAALALYIVFLFFDKGLYRDKRLRLLAVIAIVAGIGLLALAMAQGGTWAYELFGMVEKVLTKNDSYTSRVDSILMDGRLFFQSPLIGNPMEEVMYSVPNNTATSPILFAIFGIVGGCVHVLSWVALAWRKERHWLMNIILLVILFLTFNTQNVMPDMFFWLFPMLALTERGLMLPDKLKERG